MAFYDVFVESNLEPKIYWKEQLQELVDASFSNSSTVQFDVEEETGFGTLNFKNVECRITTLVDAKTGQRVNDDYKKIIFKDLNKTPEIGARYRFDNNIWMVFSTDNIKTDTSSAYLRRCNNVIGIEDEYGNLHYEPCYIDYKITETQLFKEYTLDVPAGRIWVTCQLNKNTESIAINKRYIFNGTVYKVREQNRFDRQFTFDKNTARTISFYADVDAKSEYDRFDIDIADYFNPLYQINTESNIINKIGYKDKIEYSVLYDGNVIDDEVVYFESSDIKVCTVNKYNGEYDLVGIGECTITIHLLNNPNITNEVHISVIENTPNIKNTIINPTTQYIRLNEKIDYTVYEYDNGDNRLDTKYLIKAYDIPSNCFIFNSTENSFSVEYIRKYDGILKIVCTNLSTNIDTEFFIELGGLW